MDVHLHLRESQPMSDASAIRQVSVARQLGVWIVSGSLNHSMSNGVEIAQKVLCRKFSIEERAFGRCPNATFAGMLRLYLSFERVGRALGPGMEVEVVKTRAKDPKSIFRGPCCSIPCPVRDETTVSCCAPPAQVDASR